MKQAAFAMNQELNSEMTEEERERLEKSGMGIGGGLNKGEDTLFGACRARTLCTQPMTRLSAWCSLGHL